MSDDAFRPLLARIADALDRLAPPPPSAPDWSVATSFVFEPRSGFRPAPGRGAVPLALLKGIDLAKDLALENVRRFADGLPANNALLWGAKGMGKSSLVKAVHAAVNRGRAVPLILVEIHREDLESLPGLMRVVRDGPERRFLLFCDDLSFDAGDASYKSLKSALEGGVEGRPANVLFIATSNRRHLLPRDMMENERATAINPGEAIDEKVSLSDRFGLWIGFHPCGQAEYLAMVSGYAEALGIADRPDELRAAAIEWTATRGARSGRVAWQFTLDYAARRGVRIEDQLDGAR